MKTIALAAGISAVLATASNAGGLEVSGQPIGILFEQENLIELGYTSIRPDVSGMDHAPFAQPTGQVVGGHDLAGLAIKFDITDSLSAALTTENPYALSLAYPGADAGGSFMLGGTRAELESGSLVALLRKRLTDGFAIHGGLQASRISGDVRLSGAAYGPDFSPSDPMTWRSVSGYGAELAESWKLGYILGASYERPEIGLRLALTYYSAIRHDLETVETLPGGAAAMLGTDQLTSRTNVTLPQALSLDVQTGIAQNTGIFGSVRWADWSGFRIDTAWLKDATGVGLAELDDTIGYAIGVGHRFNENWSGAVFALHESGSDVRNTPLMPTNGYRGLGLSVSYEQDKMRLTFGASRLHLGDSEIETGPPWAPRASMSGRSTNMTMKVAVFF